MDKKYLAVAIVAVIVVVALAASYFAFFSTPKYKNVTLNGITMEVPDSNASVNQQTGLFSIYNDTQNNIDIMVYDSTNAKLDDLSEAVTFAGVRDMFQVGAVQKSNEGLNYNYSETTKAYSYVTNYTHKNLLIVTSKEEDMIHILKSIRVDEEISLNVTNETEQSAPKTTTKKASSSSDNVREEDKVTSEGWDPKEHEVYRESMDEGMEKVHYDDGYFRVVNKKGDIVSYGY